MNKKYIKINLNQLVSRFQKEEMRIERIRNYILFGLILCFAVLFSINSYTNSKLNMTMNERKSKLADIKKQIKSLTSSKNKDEQKVDMSDIDNLFKFEDKRIYWTPKIQALTNLTPIEMALTEIEFDSKTLSLTAIIKFEKGMDTEKPGVDLVEEIKKHSDINNNFIEIQLIESYTGEIQGQKAVFYDIEAKMKKTKKRRKKKKT